MFNFTPFTNIKTNKFTKFFVQNKILRIISTITFEEINRFFGQKDSVFNRRS
jgi:hypothetical protein